MELLDNKILIRHASLALLLVGLSFSVSAQTKTSYVDPFIGTDGMGHTFPGACVPFGGVQLSPDTDSIPHNINGKYQPMVYETCAGYRYNDPTIVGFSHTHFSGTGHSDLGDILIMPATGPLKLNPGTADNPDSGFRSRFSHSTESSRPGLYEVTLDDYDIKARESESMNIPSVILSAAKATSSSTSSTASTTTTGRPFGPRYRSRTRPMSPATA